MATSWIEQKAEEYKRKEEILQFEAEARRHQFAVIQSRWQEVKRDLEKVVRDTVAEWNAALPQEENRIDVVESTPREFRIHKKHYPGGVIVVTFNPVAHCFQCELMKLRPGQVSASPNCKIFSLRMADDDSIYITDDGNAHVSAGQIAKLFIESLA